MAFEIGQTSTHGPGLAFLPRDGSFYMAFKSQDASNRLLTASSADGLVPWGPARESGQFTKCAPALAVVSNRLIAVFVANDSSNRILVGELDSQGVIGSAHETGETGKEVRGIASGGSLLIYFVSNEGANRLLGLALSV